MNIVKKLIINKNRESDTTIALRNQTPILNLDGNHYTLKNILS